VMDVGIDKMQEMAHRLGVTDLRQDDCGPTITLGACEVKLVDMTYAFATLANNGVMRGRPSGEDLPEGFRQLDPVSVLKIEDAEGNLIYQYGTPAQRLAIDGAYSYMLTDILSRDATKWSGLGLDRPAAVKTGTSEDFRDNVVLGYTPDLAAGVWMGNTDNTPMAQGTFSSAGTGPIWQEFMTQAHHYLNLPPKGFEKPANVVTVKCGGRDEPFESGKQPSRPGACSAPRGPGGPTSNPTEGPTEEPTAAPTQTATPGPTAAGTPAPSAGASKTPKPTSSGPATPSGTPEPTAPLPSATPEPTPVVTDTPVPGG